MDVPALKRLRGAPKGGIIRYLADLDDFLDIATPAASIGKKESVERNLKLLLMTIR